MSAALRGMVSGRGPHDATTRRPIIKACGLKISGPFRTKIIRGKTWPKISPAEIKVSLACNPCDPCDALICNLIQPLKAPTIPRAGSAFPIDQLTGDNSFLPQASAAATVRMLADEPLALAQPAAPGGRTISDVVTALAAIGD